MQDATRYDLVFAKLHDALKVSDGSDDVSANLIPSLTLEELDEIEVLRRIVTDVTESTPTSYTTT